MSKEWSGVIKEAVREGYAKVATLAASGTISRQNSCCTPCGYGEELADLPDQAVAASQGCGNPVMLARLQPGETVLDLGSGGGIDVLLSAKRVGPTGKAYGLDMTDEMLALARDNQRKTGIRNVEFLKGDIEQIPLPDASVDVVISNCVINLSPEKDRVFTEVRRVLKPGGRFAVADILKKGSSPSSRPAAGSTWVSCVDGAMTEPEYRDRLTRVGFEGITVESLSPASEVKSTFSAFVRAEVPR